MQRKLFGEIQCWLLLVRHRGFGGVWYARVNDELSRDLRRECYDFRIALKGPLARINEQLDF